MRNDFIIHRYKELCRQLISEMNPEGFWRGHLATSALSTAVAIAALKINNCPEDEDRIRKGAKWLVQNINPDGGYGDTTNSVSNVSTTLLSYAAIKYCYPAETGRNILTRIEEWLAGEGISADPDKITDSVLKYYGRDLTFSVPILSMLTICGIIPENRIIKIPRLPFEFSLLPRKMYRFLNLGVVSYALPALIGAGIYLHVKRNRKASLLWQIRNRLTGRAIRKLEGLVPESGGFLEAIPLTGFVVMCLIACGMSENTAVKKGIGFLRKQQRDDGGWPIDTDLSTWVTTLAVKAFGSGIGMWLNSDQIAKIRDHLLRLQNREVHPFNGARPGGWGWTDYSGAVPDADDTPGAILALLEIYSGKEEEKAAILNGCKWLIDLQNSDGGFPTFCRGWGKLPFDKSCPDLTGHAFLALVKSLNKLENEIQGKLKRRFNRSITKAAEYLKKNQKQGGEWLPLWFGNQYTNDKSNPVYGTAKVCTYLTDSIEFITSDVLLRNLIGKMTGKAQEYLSYAQNEDGSWGGGKGVNGTVEETSLAVTALAGINNEACTRGITWLEKHDDDMPSPIGLYFALLWYFEKLYPLIFRVEAHRKILEHCQKKSVVLLPSV